MEKRTCCIVISKIVAKIPETEKEFIGCLCKLLNSSLYAAPEDVLPWIKLTQIVNNYIPEAKQNWEFEVVALLTNKHGERRLKMKLLLKKLVDTLLCCLLAGSFGWFVAHEYERWHPGKVEIVYVEKPIEAREKGREVRVVKLINRRMVGR